MSRTLERPVDDEARMSEGRGAARAWSWPRVGGALVLAAWAGLFWFLILADRVDLYLSTRTSWVVPMAAVGASPPWAGLSSHARGDRSRSICGRAS